MNKIKRTSIGILFIIIGIALLGCVPKGEHEALQWELDDLVTVYTELETDYAQLELELEVERTTLSTLLNEQEDLQKDYKELGTVHSSLQRKSAETEQELIKVKQFYPPRHFATYDELQQWVNKHCPTLNQESSLLEQHLALQEEALMDGYIWSVGLEDDCYNPSNIIITSSVIAGDSVYSVWTDGYIEFYYIIITRS